MDDMFFDELHNHRSVSSLYIQKIFQITSSALQSGNPFICYPILIILL